MRTRKAHLVRRMRGRSSEFLLAQAALELPQFFRLTPLLLGAMADAQSETAFGRAAVAFRFPAATDFDDFVKKVVRTKAGYRDHQGVIQTYPRPTVVPWEEFRHDEDVGCLRKLWALAAQVAKKQIERLAGDDGEKRVKVTLTLSQEMEDAAINSGMPEPSSDKERPSLHTLSKVQNTFGPGGSFQHLPWESFVNMEVENQLRRAGKIPKDKKEIVVTETKLELQSKETEIMETQTIEGVLALQDVFNLRARAFHVVDVCKFGVVSEYSGKIISLLRATTPEGMRQPTLNEARRADREIMGEIMKWVSKGKGTIEAGLNHYTHSQDDPLWKLMSQQPESLPDQGRERAVKGGRPVSPEADPPRKSKRPREEDHSPEDLKGPARPRFCLVCKKRHEPRCRFPLDWRQQQKERKKERRRSDRDNRQKKSDADKKDKK